MIVDLASGAALPETVFDVCVIGTGPAGTTVARELAGSGLSVCVLESGRLKTTRHADALRRTVSSGITIKEYSRERVLGGASTTWAGLSSPLDDVDLAPRACLEGDGWPFGRDVLDPFYRAAAERFRFAPLEQFDEQRHGGGFRELRARSQLAGDWLGVLDEKVFLACAEPQNFGAEYREWYESDDVTLVLDATALRLTGEGRTTQAVDVATSDGARHRVQARTFVVATGGIENARLLLASTDQCAAGLGNEHDQVGRFLMNHPKNYRGVLHLAEAVDDEPYVFGCLRGGYAGYVGLRLPTAVQTERGLLNSYVRFEPLFPWSDSRGVEAFVLFIKRSQFVLKAWTKRRSGDVITIRDYAETGDDSELQNARKGFFGWLGLLGLVLVHAPTVARYVWARLRDGSAPRVTRVRFRNFMEMEPRAENRVTLADEVDANGSRIARVQHDTSELDRRSMVAVHEALATEVERLGIGRLETDLATASPWPVADDASHHIGTTRMGDDVATSVVTPDARLHGADNVYLAGASVFPTSGCANPTMTIVALAIRLARHLRQDVFERPVGPVFERPIAAWRDPASATRSFGAAARRPWFVIGAGGRVTTDVLPTLDALGAHVAGVYARTPRVLDVGEREIAVQALRDLQRDDVPDHAIIYLGVAKPAVPGVLAELERLAPSRLELVVDTPVFLWKHLAHVRRLERWSRVSVAEDCATLPWLALLTGGEARPTSVTFDRSAYRYHGYAMMRELLGSRTVARARRSSVKTDLGGGTAFDVKFANGAAGRIVDPRDYARGCWTVEMDDGSVVTDGPAEGHADPAVLRPLVEGRRCTGFVLGERGVELTSNESELVGDFDVTDSVTSRMDDLKRAGLARLFEAVEQGAGGYPLDDALDDMLVDAALERLGRYRALAPLSIKSPLGRRWLTRAASLLSKP